MTPIPPLPATLGELADLVGGTLRGGDRATAIRGISSVEAAGPDQITWIADAAHARQLGASKAAAVIVAPNHGETPMPAILARDPQAAVSRVLARFETPQERPAPGVHPTAIIGPGAEIGANAAVGAYVWVGSGARIGSGTRLHAGVFIGAGTQIGRDCELWPRVYVADRCRLGDRVVVKPGAVIGSDGFGFIFRDGGHRRIPQIGLVVLEDDVEIGANSCIDRAKFGQTIIHRGTKIDNLVQVAHNCDIGPHCILTGQVGLSGSVTTGVGVVFAGASGAIPAVRICDGVTLAAKTVVTKDIDRPGGYSGNPARPHGEQQRIQAASRRLPELLTQIRELTQRVAQLEAAMHDRKTD